MRRLVIIVVLISVFAMVSTLIQYFRTRAAADELILGRALEHASSFALAARAANLDDGVLHRMAHGLIGAEVRDASLFSTSGERLCDGHHFEFVKEHSRAMISQVLASGTSATSQHKGPGGGLEVWSLIRVGPHATQDREVVPLGPGPQQQSLRVLALVVDSASTQRLLTETLIHAVLIAILLGLLIGLAVRQHRLFVEKQRIENRLHEQQRFTELGRLSAVLAHEVRNPLAAIKGFAQLTSKRFAPSDPAREDIETIVTESTRLERLVSSLLLYAKPSEPALRPCNLGELLSATVRLAQQSRSQGSMTIETRLPGEPIFAMADPEQLTQAILNILQNAMDAVDSEGRVSASLERQGEWLAITIEDSGAGIDPEILPQLFEPYVTRKSSGTGLGLSVARRAIEAHGGRIDVDSRPGQGARFTIFLPRPKEEADED